MDFPQDPMDERNKPTKLMKGVELSGGQWQRTALSCVFLRDADCYILDEPSESLDSVSEHEIFTYIK